MFSMTTRVLATSVNFMRSNAAAGAQPHGNPAKNARPVATTLLVHSSQFETGLTRHTVRDKSQAVASKKENKYRVLMDSCKNGCFSIRNEWSPIRQSNLIEGSQKGRIPAHLACS